jgi:hypothetical protein
MAGVPMRKLILALLICLISGQVLAATYLSDNFDGYADDPTNHGWSLPDTFSVVSSDSPDGGRAIMATVLASGTQYWSSIDPNPSGVFNDGYIGFWVKFVNQSQDTAGGNKFLKLFSADYPTTAANVTFAQEYTSGQFWQISHGNGETPINDTQEVFRYNGTKSAGAVGTITDYSAPFYLTDGNWHWWECRVKLNTDGNTDGAFAVWVDGIQKINVINVKNRHDDNARDWDEMSLVNYIHSSPPSTYYVYFDKITTSDTYIGVPDGGSSDTTPPTVTITTSSPIISIDGTAVIEFTDSDDIAVTSRKWRIGSAPDATHGTECTSPATITGLSVGSNTVYIGAGDAAGNWGSDSITVNYSPVASSTTIINSGIRGGGGVR